MQHGTTLAAVDLGSNSFRLEIGHLDHGLIQRSHYQKETVRLGSGLDAEGRLTAVAMQRGWDCLARFAERLRGMQSSQVRAVATQTLREAKNRADFLQRAQEILGFPIDVISGCEEARLIYQGVVHLLPQSERSAHEKRLVIDIGGRSTEVIVGQKFTPQLMQSYPVGCVAWSMQYFADGQLSSRAFQAAEVAAQAVFDEALQTYQPAMWDVVYGSSGTVSAVGDVLALAGHPPGLITREGLAWLKATLVEAKNVDALKLGGLKPDRLAVIGGGVSILQALFNLFNIKQLQIAQGALRHGLLYDLLDREAPTTDIRATSVAYLSKKFNVDPAQAQRVSQVANHFFLQIHGVATAPENTALAHAQRKLHWAAQLHEIGGYISHSGQHKHGAYILEHVDALGFSVSELHRLGLLVLGQRGKLRKLEAQLDDSLAAQLLSLRIATAVCHARRDPELAGLSLQTTSQPREFLLACELTWAKTFPQSVHLLREEAQAWKNTGWTLTLAGFDEGSAE